METHDYMLKLKYKMSGLKLLAEIAAIDNEAKEKILSAWFGDCKEGDDPICLKITRLTRDGIRNDKPIQALLDEMILTIPEEKRGEADIKGFKFSRTTQEETIERVYSEEEHKYKLRTVYPGLLPGLDNYGDSFADLAYDHESQGAVYDLEEWVEQGNICEWSKIVFRIKDDDIAVLATALSWKGRHLLFAGLEDERLPIIVEKAVLSGPMPDNNASVIAETILKEWRK